VGIEVGEEHCAPCSVYREASGTRCAFGMDVCLWALGLENAYGCSIQLVLGHLKVKFKSGMKEIQFHVAYGPSNLRVISVLPLKES
jgi:hypothetical protein